MNLEYGLAASSMMNNIGGGGTSSPSLVSGRVSRIILNINDFVDEEEKNKYMGYDAMGMIFWESVKSPPIKDLKTFNFKNIAYPLFPNLKQYPLVNEIVYIISMPGKNILEDTNNVDSYYFAPINLYQNVHQNAIPNNLVESPKPPSEEKSIEEIEAGSPNVISNKKVEINLGKTFKERPIRDLEMFEGDISLQGRWGNSIRFGSTVKDKNWWSTSGGNGEAITIIRNGQPDPLSGDTWIPIVEDINRDKSSIYLTTNQKIPIDVKGKKYNSYDEDGKPDTPSEYKGNQVILNSGRLLFNSTSDSILLSSTKTINLNSATSVNIDAINKLVISTPKIYLGNKSDNNTQPAVLGDKLVEVLSKVITDILTIGRSLESISGNQSIPIISVSAPAIGVDLNLDYLRNQLKDLLQPNVRIISKDATDNTPTSKDTTGKENFVFIDDPNNPGVKRKIPMRKIKIGKKGFPKGN